jgi:hypothetical protein
VVALAVAPRIRAIRAYTETLGDEAIELAKHAGLDLDPWQCEAVRDLMSLDERGHWLHFEFGLNVARQNGKGAVLEARELAMLFLTGERLGVHSAHEFATSQEHFRRIESLIRETDDLDRQVKRHPSGRVVGYRHSHGEESIELRNGNRLMFKTRTKSGLRGYAGVDFLALDESMIVNAASHGAMMPTLRASSAPRGPQLTYTGSAVDQEIHEHGVVWTRIRERGIAGDDPSLGYIEFSVEGEHPDDISDEQSADEGLWLQANPGLGIRISVEHMQREHRSMDHRTFCVELLGVGDYPATDGSADSLISPEQWADIRDEQSTLVDPVCIAYDVSPERHASIVAAGRNDQGHFAVEVISARAGTGWLVERLVSLYHAHEIAEVVVDGFGPAAAIANRVDEAGITVRRLDSGDYGKACGFFVDAVGERTLRHMGQDELDAAIRGARARPLVDRWAWSRTKSTVNISPLVAATLALWSANENDVGEVAIY